ncbi:hypothetical protein F1559_004686 [Cyanidiococcus yangmingshanensis]|uniref:Uncharacterized protein n=1 Tax=Cyanidiococcus yangmingshanensis TaxID=2690220 RepID=A0A7J7IM28_9RHOD|nr:hypothetical protein F1559_004686 [Cyanidiococcus yangmingshanensis]
MDLCGRRHRQLDVDAELAWNARINVPDHRDNVAFDEREKYIARLEAELSGLKQALSQTEEDAYETQSALEAQIVRLEDERGALRDELAELRTRNERDLRVYAEREDGTTDNLWGPDDDGLNQRWSMPPKESARNAEGSIGNTNAKVLVGDSAEAAVGKQMSPYINIHPDLSKDKSCSSVSATKRVDEIGLRKLQGSDQNLKSPEVKMMMLALAPLKSLGDRLREKESLVSSSLETMRKRLYAISSHVRRCQLAVKSPDSPLVFASTTERIAKTNEAPLQTASMEHFSEYHENKASVLVILEESIERILDGNRKLAELMESTSCANEQDSRVIEHIRIQGSEIDVLRARVNQLLSTKSDYDQIRGELPTSIVHSEGLEKELAARGADQARMQELETQYQLVCQERDRVLSELESVEKELAARGADQARMQELETQYQLVCQERDRVLSELESVEKELAARGADQARMQELETQYQLVCQERDTLAEHVESLQSELRLVSDYKNAVAILESQCATLRDEVMSKEENLLALKQEHDQLCESHKHCLAQGDEIERLRDDLNRSRARIHECESDLELATTDRARYAELERSHVALRQRCEELERGSQELEILLESARCDSRNQTSLQTQIADLLEKDRQRETEIERLRSELIMLQDALSSREDELQHHENQLHNLQQALKSEREEALNTEKEFEQLNLELQEQLDSLRDDYERLQMEYNDTMNVKQSLACTLSEKQEQEQSLRSQVAALEAQNLETRAAMANEDATVMRAIIEQVHSGIQYLHSMSHTHAELIKKQQGCSNVPGGSYGGVL